MNKLHLLILFITTGVFIGCGPSERELELEKKYEALMQAEQERLDEQKKQLKLNGSVFVVTKGGTNYKLGLTPVAAVKKEDFETVESLQNDLVNEFIVDNSAAYREAEAELLPLKKKLDELYKQYEAARNKLNSVEKSYNYGGARYSSKVSIYSSFREVSVYGPLNYPLARSTTADLNSNVQKTNAIARQYNTMRDQIKVAEGIMDTIASKARNRINAYYRDLAEVVPAVAQTNTKTNADGEFSLNLSRGMDFVVVAYADRTVGKSSEEYNWFIPYTPPLIQGEDTLLISNDTMASDTSPATSGLKVFESSPYIRSSLGIIEPYEIEYN